MPRSRDAPEAPRAHAALLLGCAVALVAAGLAWTTAALAREEHVERVRLEDPWRESARFTYEVPTENGTLPMGEPGYFTTRSPGVDLGFAWRAEDAASMPVTGRANLSLLVRAAAERETWRAALPLDDEPIEDGRVELAGSLRFEDAEAMIRQQTLEHGKRGERLTWTIVASVSLLRGGERFESAYEMPLVYDPPLFTLPASSEHARDHAHPVPETHVERAGVRNLSDDPRGPAALAAGLAALALALRRHKGARA